MHHLSISGTQDVSAYGVPPSEAAPSAIPTEPIQSSPQSSPNEVASFEAASFISREEDVDMGLLQAMREAQEKIAAHREKLKKVKTSSARYADAPLEAYSRLARAKSPAEAGAAAGYARRRLVQLQAAEGSDSENARQIRSAIRQLRKAIGRAGKKKRELEREQLSEKRQKKLAKERQLRKARRLRDELVRRKTQRTIRESGYFRELAVENRLQAQLAQTEMDLRAQAQMLSERYEQYLPSTDTAIQQYAAQTVPTPAAPEISVDA